MTEAELFALPVSFGLPVAGRAWGLGPATARARAREGTFPCEVLPYGNGFVVTRVALLRSLGYAVADAPAQPLKPRQPHPSLVSPAREESRG